MTSLDFNIRPARATDRDFILSLVPRLSEFGPPPWHDPAQMIATDREMIGRVLDEAPPGTAVFVAEGADGAPLGFIHLKTVVEYFSREEQGHVSDLVVAPAGEGRGVGGALMAAGEEWALGRGLRVIGLHVFAVNTRARRLYEKLGYGEDMLKYVKELR